MTIDGAKFYNETRSGIWAVFAFTATFHSVKLVAKESRKSHRENEDFYRNGCCHNKGKNPGGETEE